MKKISITLDPIPYFSSLFYFSFSSFTLLINIEKSLLIEKQKKLTNMSEKKNN